MLTAIRGRNKSKHSHWINEFPKRLILLYQWLEWVLQWTTQALQLSIYLLMQTLSPQKHPTTQRIILLRTLTVEKKYFKQWHSKLSPFWQASINVFSMLYEFTHWTGRWFFPCLLLFLFLFCLAWTLTLWNRRGKEAVNKSSPINTLSMSRFNIKK